MKNLAGILFKYRPWLLLLLGVDAFWAVLLWLADAPAFPVLLPMAALATLLFFAALLYRLCRREREKRKRFLALLTDPSDCNEKRLLAVLSGGDREQAALLASVLRERQADLSRLRAALSDYEEYVEGWAHEAKTPLALLTMLLDNRGDALSPPLFARLTYIRAALQKDVTQMLYYARLKSSTRDYRFENVDLCACVEDVLEEYAPLLSEKGFRIENELNPAAVYTDRRGLAFMLGQVIGNAVKYSGAAPVLTLSAARAGGRTVLSVSDNGVGCAAWDLPYLFQKGFTGDSGGRRQKATGMGLYLTKRMADDLGLSLNAVSAAGAGFRMEISFPDCEDVPRRSPAL